MDKTPKGKTRSLLIAGGGTGGHILAGVAVADTWKALYGQDSPILFVGASGGIEEKLVPRAGYGLRTLKIGSLNRVGFSRRLKTLIQLPISIFVSFLILVRFKPQAVLGVGGYSSGPVLLVASFLEKLGMFGIKTAVLEQNSIPGLTNRLLGKRVSVVLSAFPGGEKYFPGKQVVFTGNPIRSSMQPMPSAGRDPFVLFIFGGSQGAVGMNSVVLAALPFLKTFQSRLRMIHQTGEKDYQRVLSAYQESGFSFRVEKFIYDMPVCYSEASLIICRAGSSTLSEIAAVGRAAVLVPLPTAADNHQEKNARVYVDAGAALMVTEGPGSGEKLAEIVRGLIENGDRLASLEKSVAQFYRSEAAREIVKCLSSS